MDILKSGSCIKLSPDLTSQLLLALGHELCFDVINPSSIASPKSFWEIDILTLCQNSNGSVADRNPKN